MQDDSKKLISSAMPEALITRHYCDCLPEGFAKNIGAGASGVYCSPESPATLMTAHLPEVLNWLHGMEIPRGLLSVPCLTPVLLYDEVLSMDHVLFHYDGTPTSASLIRNFVSLFRKNIVESRATIISPSFIPKSKQKEEQDIIQLVGNATSETSFIKLNFNRIGDFWSYAVKHQCTILVTTKAYQADLAKVLFHFYKGGMWYSKLSFYLAY
ncbi:hypothetical protein MM239_07465 [Belliella sp. DSM 111904]|uniref:Uncharacterized protein n=1 Tax=Belliella filtrata TaxID=2923435 RepID=A0ABS9UYH3_9BACT|nr:hypothetical protein [Belliella filtrata]MCH7409226.1 hypothetical protein [Belliella filtrata]